jgi:hypothetical protein
MPDATAAAYLPTIKRRPKEIMEAVASAEEALSQARPSDRPKSSSCGFPCRSHHPTRFRISRLTRVAFAGFALRTG